MERFPEGIVPGRGLTRRALIGRGMAAGLAAGGVAALAACGEDEEPSEGAAVEAGAKFGGSGVADRAVEGAKALGGNPKITLVHASGNAANYTPFFEEWEKRTGHKVENFEIPIDQIVDKIFAGATAKNGDWDLVVVQPRLYGDLLGAGAITDLSAFVESYQPDIEDPEHGFLVPQNGYAVAYGGVPYGLDADSDNFVYLYRKDVLEEAGLEPATTWDAFNAIAAKLNKPDENFYGAAELVANGWGFWWWQLRYAGSAAPNAYYFEDDMTPAIAGAGGVRALELLVELRDLMPRDVPTWNYTQTYGLFAKGQAAQETAFGSLAKFCNSPKDSKIVGKFSYAPMPGHDVDGTVNSRSIFGFGNSLAVWKHSKNAEAAYLFSQWITSPEMSAAMTAQPGFSEPYRIPDAQDEKLRELYTPELMDAWNDIGKSTVPEIMLKGSNEYSSVLDRKVVEAFVGKTSAQSAMDEVAAEWEKITDRLGRESQQEAWSFLKQSYPQA